MAQRDAPRVHIETTDQWEAWLADHHLDDTGVWVISWRPPTGRPAVPYEDQVVEALRFGWIDSTRKRLDDERTMMYFARRRPGSPWARTNKVRVAQLEAAGRMLPPGAAVIEQAKADGSWTSFDEVDALIVPHDLAAALERHDGARDHWDGFPPSSRKQTLWWIVQAKRPETRATRVEETARKAALGERSH